MLLFFFGHTDTIPKGKDDICMIEQDTVKLLRECDAGVKMGVDSIESVMPYTRSTELKKQLAACRAQHMELQKEIERELEKFGDEGKKPSAMAKGMSHMKTNVKLSMQQNDHTVADLITDGCNMGVKSLNRYLNQYEAASEVTKDITKRLINEEEKLAVQIRAFL
jgi:hypothetical protein